jgi:DNA-binding NarL/FixJ family response regulator
VQVSRIVALYHPLEASDDCAVTSPKLSSLELRIVQLVAEDKKNPDIAAVIGRTEHVTKNRIRSIYNKTGMGNRVELALWHLAHIKPKQ